MTKGFSAENTGFGLKATLSPTSVSHSLSHTHTHTQLKLIIFHPSEKSNESPLKKNEEEGGGKGRQGELGKEVEGEK